MAAPVERSVEEEFVRAAKPKSAPTEADAAVQAEPKEGKGQATVSRVPFTTRVRADFSAALKRASLQRQLDGEVPNTLQDILEEALEPWLRSHGYLSNG